MRYKFLLVIVLLMLQLSGYTEVKKIDRLFREKNLGTASWCIYAIEAATGRQVVATDQKSLSPASVMKLVTTAAALDILGPEYTFPTSIFYSGKPDEKNGILEGSLILKGGGDPAFFSTYFTDHDQAVYTEWAKKIRSLGIRKVQGPLLVDISAMDGESVPGGWCWDDIGNYYGAGVSALTFHDNLYEIHFSSPATPGLATKIESINPAIPELNLENRVISSAKSGDHTLVFGAPGSWQQQVEGTIPAGQEDFVVRAALPDPPLVAGNTLRTALLAEGVTVEGPVMVSRSAEKTGRTLVDTHLSPPLKELIVPLNKESLNLFAEHLLREIGRKSSGDPSLKAGLETLNQYLPAKGIDVLGFYPSDGSGLTRSNSMTAKTLVETMKHMYDSGNREVFFNALPVAGVDGTLRNSFKGTPLEKKVRAKTGSMARVRSLAGEITSRSGKKILFAVIINNFDLASGETSKLLESILMTIYED